ncbi:carbohydrate ABC transporter permease [Paenibacillus glycanilyticus]|uniref:Sugar ABC transporter permease n=1 Tax=Paenibacillus glycanilyticus TaxID=126569 RepID=A0ABQ6G9T9_9BACL|nr:carbohydrate ABC transporter permease [Paenibacillus glycanilyticus]GLX67726.1 sugar ABC transporter permease [Paenibacillus glycanilyticus]
MALRNNVRSAVIFVLLLFPLALMFFPYLYMISMSLKGDGMLIKTLGDIIPHKITLQNYVDVLSSGPFGTYFFNSTLVAVLVVAGNVLFGSMVGYAFAKMDFTGKNVLFLAILATMMIPFQVTLIPIFLLMRELGWIDTYAALIVPSLVTPMGIFLMRQYISTIPTELIQAAKIDGSTEFGVFWRIIFPLAKPALGVMIIVQFLSSWNNFINPLILTNSEKMRTLPIGLSLYKGFNAIDWVHLMAAACVATLPVVVIFILFQKYIIAGMTSGAVKS